MRSSNGHNILVGFGVLPCRKIFDIVKGQRCNLVNCIKERNIILTPRAFHTALMQSTTKLVFFKAVKANSESFVC